ncbi:hypothetical protein FALBO_650 [Fusarium albosuccineum]|uniref:Uncharacterized protein n=1 Tax=Fusarium albosuccineum TaxID=1237068 RepID=A0A8H4LN54_9HYPO|nr:hypothetical protein FALBO_650 [Fusarium albosuccineum]
MAERPPCAFTSLEAFDSPTVLNVKLAGSWSQGACTFRDGPIVVDILEPSQIHRQTLDVRKRSLTSRFDAREGTVQRRWCRDLIRSSRDDGATGGLRNPAGCRRLKRALWLMEISPARYQSQLGLATLRHVMAGRRSAMALPRLP